MSYTTEVAKLIENQLARFVTFSLHQLAGQVNNLDFWLAEVRHALAVIDGYGARFTRLHDTQEQYVAIHRMLVRSPIDDEERKPDAPRRIADREMRDAKRSLLEVAERFLTRCYQDKLLTLAQWQEACESVGIDADTDRR